MQITKMKGALCKGTEIDLARVENSCKLHQLLNSALKQFYAILVSRQN
jgi:hypothetical protein